MLYFIISSPHFAYAAEVDSILSEDHNHERLPGPILELDVEQLELREVQQYEGYFAGYDSAVIGRAPQAATATDPTALENNVPVTTNVEQGQTILFSFLKASVYGSLSPAASGLPSAISKRHVDVEGDDEKTKGLEEEDVDGLEAELRIRQSDDPRTVYISVNVCVQPSPLQNTTVEPPPQLQLYVSQTSSNSNPGPNQDPTTQTMTLLVGGAAMYSVNATGDIFIGLYGETTTAYKNVWSAQIAASIDGYFHTYHNGSHPNLYLMDADNFSGLVRTGNLTTDAVNTTVYEAWMKHSPPFVIFANPKDDTSTDGMQNSYCGMLHSTIAPGDNGTSSNKVQTSISNVGTGQPTQQFYISKLAAATTYNLALGMYGNSTLAGNGVVGGGGQVWPLTDFTTNAGM
jgi:calcium channel MID1